MKRIFYIAIIFTSLLLSCQEGGQNPNITENNAPKAFVVRTGNISTSQATILWEEAIDPDGDEVKYTLKQGDKEVNLDKKRIYTFKNLQKDTEYSGTIIANDGNGGMTSQNFSFKTNNQQGDNQFSFNIPSHLKEYYQNVSFSKENLYNDLSVLTIAKHTNILTYSERHKYLYDIDNDLNNNDNVVLLYSGESRYWKEYQSGGNSHSKKPFNTEHVYPQSKLRSGSDTNNDGDADAITDLHHLRCCDARINSKRSNYPFTSGNGSYKLSGGKWYPGDEWKGDVARMIMYINLRYNEPWNDVCTGGIDLLLKWNKEDSVSDFEIQRNNLIEKAQGNRNPFIDNPYLATLVWGGNTAENKWK